MLRVAILLIALLATAIHTATAQTPTDSASGGLPLPGARLRVHAPSLGEPVIGELAGVGDGGLVLSIPPYRMLTVPLAEVEHLETGHRRNRADLGAVIGIVVGAGASVAALAGDFESNCGTGAFSGLCEMQNGMVVIGVLSGTALGGLLGSRVGRWSTFDEWRPIEPAKLGVGLSWIGDGPALALITGL